MRSLMACSTIPLARSTRLLQRGFATEEHWTSMSLSWQKFQNWAHVKAESRSVTILLGTPNR
jgi:hypothetical protein